MPDDGDLKGKIPPPVPPERGDRTERFATIVKEDIAADRSELLLVLRRWGALVAATAMLVYAGLTHIYNLDVKKANAADLASVKSEVLGKVEAIANRVSTLEQLKPAVDRLEAQGDRIESQLYQLAIRSGAPVVAQQPIVAPKHK